MDGDATCFVLVLAVIAVAAWVYAISTSGRLKRRVDELSLEVLRLVRRVEDAERRAETAARPTIPPTPVATVATPAIPAPPVTAAPPAEPPPLPPPPIADAPVVSVPWVVAAPVAAARVPPPAPVAAPDAEPSAVPPRLRRRTHVAAREPDVASAGRPVAESFESIVGGRWLLILGVVAVLFGLGYFLKYAIENGWINREMRVAAGTIAGLAALFFGDRLRAKGFTIFGQSMMGLGLGALYLCDYFASVTYGFYPRKAAFVVAGIVTAAGALLAVRRNAPALAWFGFFGAFLAPAMLGRNEDALEGLTLWLAVVDVGIAATLVARAWPGLDVLAGLGTMGYFLAWRTAHYRDERLGAAATCLAVSIGVVLLTTFVPAALARRRAAAASFAAAFLTALVGYVAAYDLLFPDHRSEFGAVSIGFAVLILGLAELHRARVADATADVESIRAFSLAVLAAAVPLVFRESGIAPAWSALGAACVYAGSRVRRDWLVVGGFLAIALAALNVLIRRADLGYDAGSDVFGGAFVSALTPCIALAVAGWCVRRWRPADEPVTDVVLTAASWGAVAILAQEMWRTFAPVRGSAGSEATALLTTTGAVAAFAIVMVVLARRRAGLATLPAWGPLAFVAALGVVVLGADPVRGFTLLANERFATGSFVLVALGVAAFVGPKPRDAPGVVAALYLFALVTSEILAWGGRDAGPDSRVVEREFRVQVALWVFWAVYGAACCEAGLRFGRRWLVGFGIVATLLAAGDAIVARLSKHAPVFGSEFVLALVPLAGLVAASWFLRRAGARFAPEAPGASAGAPPRTTAESAPAYGAIAYLFLLVSIEVLAWGDRGALDGATREQLRFRAQVGLSVFWAVYGAALVAAGFWRRLAALRWAGIVVLLLTVAKVFLVDLAHLDTPHKVAPFLALGVLLVAASFLYQRAKRDEPRPPEETG